MSQFMVEFDLPEFTEDFIVKIPMQQLKIRELLETGKLQSYAVSADRSKLWCVINAQNELDVIRIIGEFPLRDYLTPHIMELMFSNSVVMKVPAFSLN